MKKLYRKIVSYLRSGILSPESKFEQYKNSLLASSEVKTFTKKNLQFSPKVRAIINRSHPRYDRYLLARSPKLTLKSHSQNPSNFDTQELYKDVSENRVDRKPYLALFNVIEQVISDKDIKSITEIGCSSGPLLSFFAEHKPDISLVGIEGFEFYKNIADTNVSNLIKIKDLREPVTDLIPSDLTICLEVAEHIDPSSLDIFIENLKNSTSKWLIMSWSSTYPQPEAPPQHIAPVTYRQYKKIISNCGFLENKALTKIFRKESLKYRDFQVWWRKSGVVWEKR